jgi:hypothetical protein
LSPILGIWASQNYPRFTNSFESIQTVSLGASQTTITFSSIPSTYKHLQIRYLTRTTSASGDQGNVNMTFNSDTGANYATHRLAGNGSIAVATAATSQTSILSGIAARDGEPSNVFGAGIIDILDYTNTNKYTTIRTLTGEDANSGADEYIGLHSGLWMNTSAITTIAFTTPSSNFKQYSSFALYGIKG